MKIDNSIFSQPFRQSSQNDTGIEEIKSNAQRIADFLGNHIAGLKEAGKDTKPSLAAFERLEQLINNEFKDVSQGDIFYYSHILNSLNFLPKLSREDMLSKIEPLVKTKTEQICDELMEQASRSARNEDFKKAEDYFALKKKMESISYSGKGLDKLSNEELEILYSITNRLRLTP